jgi:hypothetical protein
MRRLKPDPVPCELIERLIQTASSVPSGANPQTPRLSSSTIGSRGGVLTMIAPHATRHEWVKDGTARFGPTRKCTTVGRLPSDG